MYVDNPLRWEADRTVSQEIEGKECDSKGSFIWHVDDVLAKYVIPKEKPEVGLRGTVKRQFAKVQHWGLRVSTRN